MPKFSKILKLFLLVFKCCHLKGMSALYITAAVLKVGREWREGAGSRREQFAGQWEGSWNRGRRGGLSYGGYSPAGSYYHCCPKYTILERRFSVGPYVFMSCSYYPNLFWKFRTGVFWSKIAKLRRLSLLFSFFCKQYNKYKNIIPFQRHSSSLMIDSL